MAHLPISLKIVDRVGEEAIVATESGHRFPLPSVSIPETSDGDEFTLDPSEMSGEEIDGLRPAMTRALLNEIIGAPISVAATDAKKDYKTG